MNETLIVDGVSWTLAEIILDGSRYKPCKWVNGKGGTRSGLCVIPNGFFGKINYYFPS